MTTAATLVEYAASCSGYDVDPLPTWTGYTYETALAPDGATDTYIFARDVNGAIVAADDDGGVGLASRITNGSTREILLGTYAPEQSGVAHVYVNDTTDNDGDTLGAQLEAELGTCDSTSQTGCSPPGGIATAADSDRDGLDDAFEVFGKDDSINPQYLPRWGANPRRLDVFLEMDWTSDFSSQPWTTTDCTNAQAYFNPAPGEVNLDGSTGIKLHFDLGTSAAGQTLYGDWGGSNGGGRSLATIRNGLFRSVLVSSGGGGEAGVPSDTLNAGVDEPRALVFVHELGHAIGLHHWGHGSWGRLECKPNYKSLMNVAWGTNPVIFSLGTTSAVLDPGAVPERNAFASDPGWLQSSSWAFTAQTSGSNFDVDWNRSGQLAEAGTTAVRAGIAWATWENCSASLVGKQRLVDASVNALAQSTPRLLLIGTELYAFYARADGSIYYVHGAVSAPGTDGSCPGGGTIADACMTWSSPVAVTGVADASSVAVYEKDGKTLVAYRSTGTGTPLKVLHATGVDATSKNLTGWSTVTTLGTATTEPEVTAMFVSQALYGVPELVGLFYANGADYKWYSAATVGGAWTDRGAVLASAALTGPGNIGPSTVNWPGRDSTYGSARTTCASFVSGTNDARFHCYDLTTDRWVDYTSDVYTTIGTRKTYARPGLAYHIFRNSAGTALGDGSVGQFYMTVKVGATSFWDLVISERRETALPPSSTLRFKWLGKAYNMWWDFTQGGVFLYETTGLGALKALTVTAPWPYVHAYQALWFAPWFDGTVHATLKDGSDFRVMQRGICAGLRTEAFCGTTNLWGY